MKYIEDIDLGDEFGPVQIEVKPNDVIDFCKTWIREEENSKNIFNAAPTRFTDEEFAKTNKLGMWAMTFQYPWDFRKAIN